MSTETYYGFVRNGTVLFPEGVPVPAEGTVVVVSAAPPHSGAPGHVLAAMAATPPVPKEWVDELERLIKEGEQPADMRNPFGEELLENGD
jgi:hypothetical protein